MLPAHEALPAHVTAILARGDGSHVQSPPRALYLDLAENVARQATAWQCDDGTIGDPHNAPGVESVTATARYCAAVGHLLAAGRCADLLGPAARAMDRCIEQLAGHLRDGTQWPCANFNLKDMLVLYAAARGRVEAAGHARWREVLGGYQPEAVYFGHHNWLFYATAAEQLRIEQGLSDRVDWIDAVLDEQAPNWTAHGMYRDPGDPVTYDLTVRQSLAMMLRHGYSGRHEQWARETLRTAAQTTLLTTSPTGVVPFGGRSAQYQMQEGMLAYLAEWQATQEPEPRLAGALRRTALLAAEAASRWLLTEPYAVSKHRMSRREPFFGQDGFAADQNAQSGYGLLAANLFAGAWHVADEGIEPRPAPAEIGGCAIHLPDAFFRAWASHGGYHVQIDTRAQPGYDATGLGRIHRIGVPVELALNMPIPAQPKFAMPLEPAPRSVALGPGWPTGGGWRWLSELTRGDAYDVRVSAVERCEALELRVRYGGDFGVVREVCSLSADGVRYEARVDGAKRIALQVPLLETDGEARSEIELTRGGARVRYRGHEYQVQVGGAQAARMEPWAAPNRNGIYRVAVFEAAGDRTECTLKLS